MYSLIRSHTAKETATEQVPPLAAALVVAEGFYKFHSFLLECGAFLATWFVLDAALQGALRLIRRRTVASNPTTP